jgi:uncharacterized protein YcfJ
VKNRFQAFASKCNLYRYTKFAASAAAAAANSPNKNTTPQTNQTTQNNDISSDSRHQTTQAGRRVTQSVTKLPKLPTAAERASIGVAVMAINGGKWGAAEVGGAAYKLLNPVLPHSA